MESQNPESSAVYLPRTVIVFGIFAAVLFALRFSGLFFPEARLWGFSHLQFLPISFAIGYAISSVIVFVLLIKPFNRRFNGCCDRLAGPIAANKPVSYAIISIASLALFWFLRMPTNFLGDGYPVINNIGNDLPVVYKWTESGAIAIVRFVYDALPASGLEGARLSYGLVSVISGTLSVFFYFKIASELSQDSTRRAFIFFILLFSGSALFFFGYAENYPILLATMTMYIYFSLRFLNRRFGLIISLILLSIALIIHLQSIFFAPSFLILLADTKRIRNAISRHKNIAIAISTMAITTGLVFFIYKYNQSLAFQIHFLPLWTGRPPAIEYAIISSRHFIDLANEIFLLIPICPILLYFGFSEMKTVASTAIGRFLLSLVAGGLLFLFIMNPRLGMARDWDVFALSGLSISLILIWLTVNSRRFKPRFIASAIFLSGLLVLPFFITNLSYLPSVDYFTRLLNLDRQNSKSGMAVLRDYYANGNQKSKADSINQRMGEYFPELGLLKQGNDLLQRKQTGQAKLIANLVQQMDPFNSAPYALRGSAYMVSGQYDSALDDLQLALQFEPYNAGNQYHLGQLYFYQKRYDEAFAFFRSAYSLDPNSFLVLQGLGSVYYAIQRYDSGLVYFEKSIQTGQGFADSYLMAGYCAFYVRNNAKTKYYLESYLAMVPNSPQKQTVEQILGTIR